MEEVKKICTKCNKELSLEAFNKGNSRFGRRSYCRECEHKIQNTPEKRARRNELRRKRRENPEYVKRCNQKDAEARHKRVEHYLWKAAEARAKKNNISFTITEEDIILPEKCPILEIELTSNYGMGKDNSYSIDRIDPTKGYDPDNIWIISRKANAMKNNASKEELKLFCQNITKYLLNEY